MNLFRKVQEGIREATGISDLQTQVLYLKTRVDDLTRARDDMTRARDGWHRAYYNQKRLFDEFCKKLNEV